MKKKNLRFLALMLGFVLALTSCSKDDDSGGNVVSTAPLQVTVVFDPGQLGDQGYADRILSGLQKIQSENDSAGQIDTKYLYQENDEKTKSVLLQWIQQRNNPFSANTSYDRRLLVLTTASQLEWIKSATINENDEVLLLNTDKNILSSSSLGNRIHVLNISVAASIEKYFDFIDKNENYGWTEIYDKIGLLRQTNHEFYADSLAQAIQKHYGDKKTWDTFYFDDFRGDDTNYITAGYRWASFMLDPNVIGFSYAVINAGVANSGFDNYILHSQEGSERYVYLDSEKSLFPRFSICRKFDEALISWVNRWKDGTVGSMPQEEWHGDWDGYVSDYFDL